MDLRLIFNQDAENYDKWRPAYCEEVFKDIMAYAHAGQGTQALEIGIGTGQATRPFLEAGCAVTAIELGKDLADYSQAKFKDFGNFTVSNTAFEDYEGADQSVDLIYSATAFHWIPEQTGYPKASRLLQPGGTLALFWNRPFVAREEEDLHQRIQRIYQQYRPSSARLFEHDTDKYDAVSGNLHHYGFREVQLKLYHLTRTFSSADYISLLNTYSDHRSLSHEVKVRLENDLQEAILQSGDALMVYDTIDLHLARKE